MQLFWHLLIPLDIHVYTALRVTIDYGVTRSQPVVCAMSEKCPRRSPTFWLPLDPWWECGVSQHTPDSHLHGVCVCVRMYTYIHVRIKSYTTYDACPTSSRAQLIIIIDSMITIAWGWPILITDTNFLIFWLCAGSCDILIDGRHYDRHTQWKIQLYYKNDRPIWMRNVFLLSFSCKVIQRSDCHDEVR